MKKVFQLVLVLSLAIGLVGCLKLTKNQKGNQNSNLNVYDQVQPGEVAVIESNIIVTKPLSNETIAGGFEVSGRANVFENTVFYRLKDAWEKVIADGFTTISIGTNGWGAYSAKLEFDLPSSAVGWLEVYSKNAKDGHEENLIRLPLRFKESKKPIVKVYFNNTEGDPGMKDCSKVYPIEREVGYANTLLVSAIGELLSGPREDDKNNGFVSQIPTEGVKVQKLEVKDGVAYIDFNQALQQGVAGSCRVIAIRSQITETLKQFEEVKDVKISIDGKTEEILQP